uniref:Uncharacterized protein n=1 Tax=Strongyloides venezuelensis TaxID=75913 RepID=A0A0K0F5E9_STRVS
MDGASFFRNEPYYDNDSYTMFNRYGEARDQADGRPNDSLSDKSLTLKRKIFYCFTPKIAITTILLITLCFLSMNLYILFDNAFNPDITENDIIINIPVFFMKDGFAISYNHLRISFSFVNSFFLSLSLVFTFGGYYTGALHFFKFQQFYILFELLIYLTLSIFIFCCYILGRSELSYVLKELQHFFGFCFLFTMGPRIIISIWVYYVLDSDIFDYPRYCIHSF